MLGEKTRWVGSEIMEFKKKVIESFRKLRMKEHVTF